MEARQETLRKTIIFIRSEIQYKYNNPGVMYQLWRKTYPELNQEVSEKTFRYLYNFVMNNPKEPYYLTRLEYWKYCLFGDANTKNVPVCCHSVLLDEGHHYDDTYHHHSN